VKIKLTKPTAWDEVTYTELDIDLERLTGADSLAVTRKLRKEYPKEPVLQPETDDRYVLAMAARAARVPEELFGALPLPEFARVKMEVQAFLLGAAGEVPEETES